ncbi:MAG: hypothetical protein H7301_14775 [Cryobacterium sp.]|nr:hypothetical protein [Oligoflexia bacterium]
MDEKKDLTALTLTPPESGEPRDPSFSAEESPESPDESLDDLFAPMAPTAPGSEFDPLAELLPMDPEIENLANASDFLQAGEAQPSNAWETPVSESEQADWQSTPLVTETAPELLDDPFNAPLEGAPSEPSPKNTASTRLNAPMEEVRHYSDHLAPSMSKTAETPYSLLIDGFLKDFERETLLSLLSRENLGIREVELEPQFESGRILIPRISEYAGVLIVQSLRNAHVKMRLDLAEKIFASKEIDADDHLIFPPSQDSELLINEEGHHPADSLVLTTDDSLEGRGPAEVLDTLHGSMNLKAAQLAHPQAPLFQDALEKLKRQLKFQAYHRGAQALLSFKYDLHPLEGQTIYKLIVQAKAVRF